jgi:hypothetical protein
VIDGVTVLKYRPYAPGGPRRRLRPRVRVSFLATARLVLPRSPARRLHRAAGLQPARHLLAARALPALAGRLALRVRPPRPLPRALRLALPRRRPARAARSRCARTGPRSGRPTTSCRPTAPTRRVAVDRGGKASDDVTVVRTGPDPVKLRRRAAVPELKRGRRHLVAYLGVMGPQDGVDLAVRAAHHVVHVLGRTDVAFTFMGGRRLSPRPRRPARRARSARPRRASGAGAGRDGPRRPLHR